ncbi:MAG TPA: hypothetical protein VK899_03560, partial [Gemmatimonadales bacterium]|nr:hypothetical protein [Gemmatimonadales bacterium]
MIKINLVREGRAVRGAGQAPAAAAAATGASNINNILIIAVLLLAGLAAAGYWFVMKRQLDERKEIVEQR